MKMTEIDYLNKMSDEDLKQKIKDSPDSFQYIYDKRLNQEICNIGVENLEDNIVYIPEKYHNKKMALIILKKSKDNLKFYFRKDLIKWLDEISKIKTLNYRSMNLKEIEKELKNIKKKKEKIEKFKKEKETNINLNEEIIF